MKILQLALGAIFTLLVLAGGPLVWWYDRRSAGENFAYTLPIPFWHPTVGLPLSLKAKDLRDLAAYQNALAAAEKKSQVEEAGLTALKEKVESDDVEKQAAIRVVYKSIIQKVPTYVDQKSVADCTVPVGFVRLFNAAANGAQLPEASAASSLDNEAPSGVGLDTVANTTARNFEKYREVSQELLDAQAYIMGITKELNPEDSPKTK